MSSPAVQHDSDDDMDLFMDKFKTQRYKNGFKEDTWEEVRSTSQQQFITLNYLISLGISIYLYSRRDYMVLH